MYTCGIPFRLPRKCYEWQLLWGMRCIKIIRRHQSQTVHKEASLHRGELLGPKPNGPLGTGDLGMQLHTPSFTNTLPQDFVEHVCVASPPPCVFGWVPCAQWLTSRISMWLITYQPDPPAIPSKQQLQATFVFKHMFKTMRIYRYRCVGFVGFDPGGNLQRVFVVETRLDSPHLCGSHTVVFDDCRSCQSQQKSYIHTYKVLVFKGGGPGSPEFQKLDDVRYKSYPRRLAS